MFHVGGFLNMSVTFDSPIILRRLIRHCVHMGNSYHLLGFTVRISGKELNVDHFTHNCQFLQWKSPVFSLGHFTCPPDSWEQMEGVAEVLSSYHAAFHLTSPHFHSHISPSTSFVPSGPGIAALGVNCPQNIPLCGREAVICVGADLSNKPPFLPLYPGSPSVALGASHFWVFSEPRMQLPCILLLFSAVSSLLFLM